MKATGIVRRIDDLGRVVIPKEIRRTMRIREGATVGIREGWNGGKWLRDTRRLDAARQAFLLFTSINLPDSLRPFYEHRAFACTF